MKTRRRRQAFEDVANPMPFDYTLMSHLYVHADDSDVIDFAGFATPQESRRQVQSFIQNKSFVAPPLRNAAASAAGPRPANNTGAATVAAAPETTPGNTYLHLQVDVESAERGLNAAKDTGTTAAATIAPSYLANVMDSSEHIWLFLQENETQSPFARLFSSPQGLFDYMMHHNLRLPSTKARSNKTKKRPSKPPLTRWIDIQTGPLDNNPTAQERLRAVLSKFPVSQETIDDCLYLSAIDSVDTEYLTLSKENEGYLFFTLACTPVTAEESGYGDVANDPFEQPEDRARTNNTAPNAETDNAPLFQNSAQRRRTNALRENKTVMNLRFDAVSRGKPRSSVPEPVPVAVVAFTEYIITIHEQPFAELDDVLRMVRLYCFSASTSSVSLGHVPRQRFTTPVIFTTLFQVVVGHHIDSVTLSRSVDELGDAVFEVRRTQRDRDRVVRHITDLRRCFGECGADVARRINIMSTLLQPGYQSFQLLRSPHVRQQLRNMLAHLRYVQQELSDCRDTVAVSNWYHNITLQWDLLRKGNRALRSVLWLTEVTNIVYPVLIFQTLYAMNVPVPWDSEGDPPSESYLPFIVFSIAVIAYSALCGRVVLSIFRRKSFQTRLLA